MSKYIKWAVLVGVALLILAILYFAVGIGMVLVAVGCYLLGAFVPPKRLLAVAVVAINALNGFTENLLTKNGPRAPPKE